MPKLTVKVAQAKSAVDRAQQALGKRKGRVSKAALRKAEKSLKAYAKLLDTKKAAKTVPDGTRSNLKSSLGGLQSDVAALPTT